MKLPPASVTSGHILMHDGFDRFAVTEARHTANLQIPLHAHAAAFITYVVDGSVHEKMDTSSYRCRPGHVLFKPTGTAHSNVYGPDGSRSFSIQIPSDLERSLAEAHQLPDRPRISSDAHIERAVRVILDNYNRRDNLADLNCEENLRSIFNRFQTLDGDTNAADKSRYCPDFVNKVFERIESEFQRPPRLLDLALDVNVHPDYLSRSFRQATGSTISEQIQRRRVEEAARNIRSTRLPLSHIALDAGFCDQSHMTRVMKQYLGLTPGEFKDLVG